LTEGGLQIVYIDLTQCGCVAAAIAAAIAAVACSWWSARWLSLCVEQSLFAKQCFVRQFAFQLRHGHFQFVVVLVGPQ
jgi:hypothetical protein